MKKSMFGKALRYIILLACVLCGTSPAFPQEELWSELNAKAIDLKREGDVSNSTIVAKRALEIAKKLFKPRDERRAISLNTLADVYVSQGKYSRAEPLLKRALAIRTLSVGDRVTEKDLLEIAAGVGEFVIIF